MLTMKKGRKEGVNKEITSVFTAHHNQGVSFVQVQQCRTMIMLNHAPIPTYKTEELKKKVVIGVN